MKPRQSSKPSRRSNEEDRILGFFKDQVNKLTVDPFTKGTWSENTIIDTQTQTETAMPTETRSQNAGLIGAAVSLVGAVINTVGGILSAL
jgi:hypothetical protein